MKKYALVKDKKIIKFRNIPDDDTVIIPKLLAHDYRIVKDQEVPVHDYITQTLTDAYEVQKDKVLRVWTIEERPFVEAQQAKKDAIEMEAIDKIKEAFDEADQGTKIDKVLNKKDSTNVKIAAAKNNVELRAVKTSWETENNGGALNEKR